MQKTVDPLKGKYKSVTAVRAIRNYDPEFDAKEFPQMAEQIYIDAHEALAGKRKKKLHELVTENAYPNMIHQTENVSMYWEYIESLEAPTVKQVRIGEILTKDNKFAQVTVRFHTKQVCIKRGWPRLSRLEPSVIQNCVFSVKKPMFIKG